MKRQSIDLYCREVLTSSPKTPESKVLAIKPQKLSELYPKFKNTDKDEYIHFSYPDVKDKRKK